jgi:integrase
MASYIVRHARAYFKYKRAVPNDLRDVVGRKAWTEYISASSKHEAKEKARPFAIRDDRRIRLLRSLPHDERQAVVEYGAWDDPTRYKQALDGLDKGAEYVNAVTLWTAPDETDDEATQAQDALEIHRAAQQAKAMRAKAAKGRKTLRHLSGNSNGLDVLHDNWQQQSKPQPDTAKKYRLYLRRFQECVGDLEAREVRPEHVRKWRDALQSTYSPTNTGKHLEGLNAMFRAARSAGIVETVPSDGIKPSKQSGKHADAKSKKPFTPEDVRAIFKAMKKMPEDFQWMCRLLAYHGARSGELAQLRVEDVKTVLGIPILDIHDRHGSLKNRHSVRQIPIHPKCRGIIDYAKKRNSECLFGSFPMWKGKRAGYFQKIASVWLRKEVKITDRNLTMHSLRHLWRLLARELTMPTDYSAALIGHSLGKGDHANYGGVPSLKTRAEWMAKIDPLA